MAVITMNEVLGQLDEWNRMPDFELERRLGTLYSLYLPVVLREHFRKDFECVAVPGFPLRLGTLARRTIVFRPNRSANVDFIALSKNPQRVFLVRVKYDTSPLSDREDRYLRMAADCEVKALVDGALTISRAASDPRSYVHLIWGLSILGMVHVPTGFSHEASLKGPGELRDALREVENRVVSGPKPEVVYVQPRFDRESHRNDVNYIYFEEFASALQGCHILGKRFAESLLEWAGRD